MTESKDSLINRQCIGGAALGAASAFFFMMMEQLTHYELYGEFLISFSLSLVIIWWYPIYMEGKT